VRKISWIPWGLCVILAFVIALYAQHALNASRHFTKVVVATKTVQPYTRITKDDVSVVDRVLVNYTGMSIPDTKSVIGKYTSLGLVPGEIVSSAALSSQGSYANVSADERIVPVPLTQNDFPITNLAAGDYVDVKGIVQGKSGSAEDLAEHVQVLATVATQSGSPPKVILEVPNNKVDNVTAAAATGNARIVLDPVN
jgi:Flp pilus assembly protein CpaB